MQVIWWAFSSTASEAETLKSPLFLGTSGPRTLFAIESKTGVDISHLSASPSEKEVILLPGTCLEVVSIFSPAPELTMIQMRQIDAPSLIN